MKGLYSFLYEILVNSFSSKYTSKYTIVLIKKHSRAVDPHLNFVRSCRSNSGVSIIYVPGSRETPYNISKSKYVFKYQLYHAAYCIHYSIKYVINLLDF